MTKFLLTWFCLFTGFFILVGISLLGVSLLGPLGFIIILMAALTGFVAWACAS